MSCSLYECLSFSLSVCPSLSARFLSLRFSGVSVIKLPGWCPGRRGTHPTPYTPPPTPYTQYPTPCGASTQTETREMPGRYIYTIYIYIYIYIYTYIYNGFQAGGARTQTETREMPGSAATTAMRLSRVVHLVRNNCHPISDRGEREFFIDNLLVRIHLIIKTILVDRPCAMGV